MMELNERFYLSGNAPEYVIFNLQPIDGRFPPLEDAYVLRDLLAHYGFTLGERDFLLLHRASTAKPTLTLLKEGFVGVDEKIDLRDQRNANFWLEIDLQPTLLGRLRQFLYKPTEVGLVVRCPSETAPVNEFFAPAVMLSAGFLASPLLLNNKDVLNLYTDGTISSPDSYSVELNPGWESLWQPRIHYRIYRIDNKLGAHPL
jgi:hypothetical protein